MPSTPNPLDALFAQAVKLGASDIHVAVGCPIFFRISGQLMPQTKENVTPEQATGIVKGVSGEQGFRRLTETRDLDTSYALSDGTRLRVNCAFEKGNPTLAARIVPTEIPSLELLELKEIAPHLINHRDGLILFTGPTGTGKSTSLASLIRAIQEMRAINLITLEDPIEFLFPHAKGISRQREYGMDFQSFAEGLKHVLREDPDVVMVGEMRDPETIAATLTLAETGHLTFATLHTPNAIQTIDRIIDVFPPHQQLQVRSQLSFSLKAVVAQRLVPKVGGGRIAVREVLLNTPAVANIIRENRAQELTSILQTNEAMGMVTFAKAAKRLYDAGTITKETCEWLVQTS